MRRFIGFALALAIGWAALGAIPAATLAAAEDKEGTKLALATYYLFQKVDVANARPARRIGLNVTLDEKGSGKGFLVLDPNIEQHDLFGDVVGETEIAIRTVAITLTAVAADDPAKKGRRLYEIKGEELKSRLFLVVSPPEAGAPRLVVANPDGIVQYSFPLQGSSKGQ